MVLHKQYYQESLGLSKIHSLLHSLISVKEANNLRPRRSDLPVTRIHCQLIRGQRRCMAGSPGLKIAWPLATGF